jgi:hypothetical protein
MTTCPASNFLSPQSSLNNEEIGSILALPGHPFREFRLGSLRNEATSVPFLDRSSDRVYCLKSFCELAEALQIYLREIAKLLYS